MPDGTPFNDPVVNVKILPAGAQKGKDISRTITGLANLSAMDEHINGRLYDHSMSEKLSQGGWWTVESENKYSSTIRHTSYFGGGYNGSKTLPDWGVIIRQAKYVKLSSNVGDYRIDFGVMEGHIQRGSKKTADKVVPRVAKSVRNTVPPVSENHAIIGFVQFEFKYEWQTFRVWYEITLQGFKVGMKQATPQQAVLLNRMTKLEVHKYEEISEHNSTLIQRTDPIFEKTAYGRSPNEERKEQMKNLPNAVTRTQFGQVRFIRIGPAATKLSGDSLAANIVPGTKPCRRHHGGFFFNETRTPFDW